MQKKKTRTVLVVDNDPSILELVDKLLSSIGYQPILASSGEEAIDIASKKSPIDLLVTDIDIPGINSIALVEHFCTLYPKIKILFMSGYTLPSTLYSILGKKVTFLQKPFRINTLIAKMKFVLG